ncbi:MAG: tetratricopeptide repeat protein [Flavobacteriales bacterium]
MDSLRTVWLDAHQPDSVRFSAYYDLVWDGYLFSDPDTARIMALTLQQQARSKQDHVFEARASELIAASWYVQGDLRTALLHYDTALALHKRNRDDEGYADVLTNMASMRSFLGELDTALVLYGEGLAIHERMLDSVSIANDLNAIGRVHMTRGDHARAVDHFKRSLRIQQALHNQRGLATGFINLGALYLLQGDYAKALERYEEALVIAEELDDRHLAGKILVEIGTCHEELGDKTLAIGYYRRSLAEREAIVDEHGIIGSLNKLGELQRQNGALDSALATFRRSAELGRSLELPFGEGTALVGIAHTLMGLGRSREAITIAEKAQAVANDAEDLSLNRDVAALLFKLFKATGKNVEALAMHERFVLLNDSMMREENQREVLRYEFAYTYEQQALADSLRHQQEQFARTLAHADQLGQERNRRNMFGAGLGLALLLALGIWARMRYMAKADRAIVAAQAQLIESERQLESEKVRTRIASDIHDDLGSDLTKIGSLCREIKRSTSEQGASTAVLAERVVSLSDDAAAALSQIVWAADPAQDSAQGLVARAAEYAHRMLVGSGIEHRLHFAHEGADLQLEPGIKHDVFMLLKELLNNALKHAQANRIDVSLVTNAVGFKLAVQDDGKGYDTEGIRIGNGMRSIVARSKRIGAVVTTKSAPGKGCSVRIEGPWNGRTGQNGAHVMASHNPITRGS